jgi:flagellar motor switch protein FliN
MSETAATSVSEPLEHMQAWARSMEQALAQISGTPVPCTVLPEAPPELTPAGPADLWLSCACSGGLRGEMSLRLPTASALALAQIFMNETAGAGSEVTPQHREAVVELFRQVAGLTASALKPRWGEVQLPVELSAGAPSWPSSACLWLRAGESTSARALIEVHISAALGATLRLEKEDTDKTAVAGLNSARSSLPATVKLDVLMDVELAVTLRFGSRRLALREILDLNPGAVVELDRQVREPVDLLLDGRLLARGEVVVVEGNYGLRVIEVAPAGS